MIEHRAAFAAQLLASSSVAALGTLHDGAPAVSMVPYAIVPTPLHFVMLISTLAAHTRDLIADPRVGWMVMQDSGADGVTAATVLADSPDHRSGVRQDGDGGSGAPDAPDRRPPHADPPPHARPRVAIQGRARPLDSRDATYSTARLAYLTRFTDMAGLFALGDFGLWAVEPRSVRVVAGFADAYSLEPETLAAALLTRLSNAHGR